MAAFVGELFLRVGGAAGKRKAASSITLGVVILNKSCHAAQFLAAYIHAFMMRSRPVTHDASLPCRLVSAVTIAAQGRTSDTEMHAGGKGKNLDTQRPAQRRILVQSLDSPFLFFLFPLAAARLQATFQR